MLLSSLGGGFAPPPNPPFFVALQRSLSKRPPKVIIFFAPLSVSSFQRRPFLKKVTATYFFRKRYKLGYFEDFEKPPLLGEKVELLPARFLAPPPENGCKFFSPFVFSCFSVSSASNKRVFQKKAYFYRVFEHPSKVSSNIMQQQTPKPCTSPKTSAPPIFGKPRFWPKATFQNTNFAPPPENCALKKFKQALFYRLRKGGQVIDLEVAKLLTLKTPKCGQVIDPTAYIYICAGELISWPIVGPSWADRLAKCPPPPKFLRTGEIAHLHQKAKTHNIKW